jgi:SagB-type dehydrogenase family enzyme
LPRDVEPPTPLLSHVLRGGAESRVPRRPAIEDLSRIFLLAYTLTAKAAHGGGDFYFRNAASAGALYPTELYVAAAGITGLEDGLYHFSIADHGLSLLRKGKVEAFRVPVRVAAGKPLTQDRTGAAPALVFYLTAIFFRSAWKYRDRAYRYHLLDTGHVLENLTLALKARGLPFRVAYDFDDKAVTDLLEVDEEREAVLAVCAVNGIDGGTPDAQDPSRNNLHKAADISVHAEPCPERSRRAVEASCTVHPSTSSGRTVVGRICQGNLVTDPKGLMGGLPGGCKAASRVSMREKGYPAILEIHRAGMGITAPDGTPPVMTRELGFLPERWDRIDAPEKWPETMNCAEAIFRRRSSRNYVPEPMSGDSLSALMEGLCMGDPDTSGKSTQVQHTLGIGLLVGHALGAQPGLYLIDPSARSRGLAAAGPLTNRMARICLDQAWLQHASLHILFMANLAAVDRRWGPRGYRYAMLNAGRLGQRLYVQATAMGLGCCGIGALYDEEAADLLGLAPESRLLYLVAVGRVKALRAR